MSDVKYHLVLSGSGADFPCFLGAIRALQRNCIGLTQNLVSVSASSGGALVGLLLLLRFSMTVMEELCFTVEYQKHLQRIELTNLLGEYGLDDASNMIKIIKRVIRQKLGNADATFADLYAFNPTLYNVTGTNLSTMSLMVFNHVKTPELSLWKAIRITTSVPLLFTSIRLGDDILCDGAIICYYPLQLVPDLKQREEVIGLCLDKTDQRNVIDDLLSYIMALAKTLTRHIHHLSSSKISMSYNYDRIDLKINEIEIYMMERNIEQKRALIDAGYTQTMAYLTSDVLVVRRLVRGIIGRVIASIVLNEAQ